MYVVRPNFEKKKQIYHCVQLNALFCCLWRIVEDSCHKHFVVFSNNQHHRHVDVMSIFKLVDLSHLRGL